MVVERLPGSGSERVSGVVRVEPAHGTRARYVHRSLRCRCPECRLENTKYQRTRRARIARSAPWRPRSWNQLTIPGIDQ